MTEPTPEDAVASERQEGVNPVPVPFRHPTEFELAADPSLVTEEPVEEAEVVEEAPAPEPDAVPAPEAAPDAGYPVFDPPADTTPAQ